jgi:hypothetical protein
MLVGYIVKLTAILALYLYMYLENKKRDREAVGNLESDADAVENGMLVSFEFGKSIKMTFQALLTDTQYRIKQRLITKDFDTCCKFGNNPFKPFNLTISRLHSVPRAHSRH